MQYKITFKNGLQSPTIVEAENEEMAKRKGLEFHRRNSGNDEMVSLQGIDYVISSVTPIN